MEGERREEGFLPPEPAGPEPDLGRPPAPGQEPPPHQGWQPPARSGPGASAPYQHAPRPAEPDNGPAVAGFVLSMVAVGLLVLSVGSSSIISAACAGFGTYYSRKGTRRVESGVTSKHRGLAQAGLIGGVVGLVLSVLATVFWVLVLVLALSDEGFQRDLEEQLEDGDTISATVAVASLAVRAAALLAA